MEQLTFNEVIDRITTKLTNSDDDTITSVYNQLFDTPIIYIGDDLWEDEITEGDDISYDDDFDDDDFDDDRPVKTKKSKYDHFDIADYDEDDNE
jgi:hypothetical protein